MLRPLPGGLDDDAVFATLDPTEDVEGAHPESSGLLARGLSRVPGGIGPVTDDVWLLRNVTVAAEARAGRGGPQGLTAGTGTANMTRCTATSC